MLFARIAVGPRLPGLAPRPWGQFDPELASRGILPEHEVPVIGLLAKRQETHRREFAGVQQRVLEGRMVGGVAEDRRPTNRAVQHVADQTEYAHAFSS